MKGLIQVYTGKGKGKTTAAMGLALRALGHGMRVCIIQFLKKERRSGEIEAIKRCRGIKILYAEGVLPVKRPVREQELKRLRQSLAEALSECENIIRSKKYDVVILDEINFAMSRGLVSSEAVLELMETKPGSVELVLTGRGAPRRVLQRANLVTRMEEVKHPFSRGVKARKGIEY